jgi:uncharacterized spore protein YtfJ
MTAEPGADPAADSVSALARRLGRDQVFGPPVQAGGTTLVPVARVRGGGGGAGGGLDLRTGVGLQARPVGAFAIGPDGTVAWHPVVDVNRIVLGGQLVVGAVLLAAVLSRRNLGRRVPGRRLFSR